MQASLLDRLTPLWAAHAVQPPRFRAAPAGAAVCELHGHPSLFNTQAFADYSGLTCHMHPLDLNETLHCFPCFQAYADYNDLIAMTEELISGLVLAIRGSYKIQYHPDGPEGKVHGTSWY